MKGALTVPLLLASCVTGSWSQVTIDEPLPTALIAALQPGEHTLTDCLRQLGAPNRLLEWNVTEDSHSGLVMLWLWRDARGFGVQVSGNVDEASGSFAFDLLGTDLTGCALWLDAGLVLREIRTGPVGELLATRRRPYPVDASIPASDG